MKTLITAVAASLLIAAGSSQAAPAAGSPPTARLIVIAADNFDGEAAIAMAKSVKHRASWDIQVNYAAAEQPSPVKTGERGDYPMFIVVNAKGEVLASHVGLANAQPVLEAAALQLSPQTKTAAAK